MSMLRLNTTQPDFSKQLQQRLENDPQQAVYQPVSQIINQVRQHQDNALIELTQTYDHSHINHANELIVPQAQIDQAVQQTDPQIIADFNQAIERIQNFHQRQLSEDWQYTDKQNVRLGQITRPLNSVGIYIPGGKANYPSSVLMNAIPALVAGVKRIAMVTPAPKDILNPLTLVAAHLCGVNEIYRVGGAQAIAALAYGTPTIAPVDKITGPGNAYVAEAKRQVFGKVGIDMIAGPSEVLIIADDTANPEWLALDLFAQAEHDESAQAILISHHSTLLEQTQQHIERLLPQMPRRAIIEASLNQRGMLIQTQNIDESITLANQVAPEHLELAVDNANQYLNQIQNAGAIFLGHHTPEAFGDYLAGSNHVLPTASSARFASPLGVYDFQKRSNFIEINPNSDSIHQLYSCVTRLAHTEELTAHAESAHCRIKT